MLFAKYLKNLKEETEDYYDIESDEQEQTIANFVINLPEESLTDELEAKRDKIINLCYEIFEDLDASHLEGDNLEVFGSLTDEIFPDENDVDEEIEENLNDDPLTEKIFLNRMSRKDKRKAKKYRRMNKVKLRRQREIWKRKNKAKLRRAKTSGIGVSGKRLGLHKRRKPL